MHLNMFLEINFNYKLIDSNYDPRQAEYFSVFQTEFRLTLSLLGERFLQ